MKNTLAKPISFVFFFLIAGFLSGLLVFLLWEDFDGYFALISIPFLLVIVYLFLFNLDALFHLTIFFLPLSITLHDVGGGLGLSLPGEVMILFLAAGAALRVLYRTKEYYAYLRHPLSIVIVVHVGWMLLTTMTSTMPFISLKFSIVRIIYVLVFYFYGIELFSNQRNQRRFFWLYFATFVIVVVYSTVVHAEYEFTQQTSNRICYPFYNDHTIYAAVMAMIIPVFLGFQYIQKKVHGPDAKYLLFWAAAAFLIIAIFMSYSRAGVLSLVIAFIGWVILRYRVGFWKLLITLSMLTVLGIFLQQPIVKLLGSNRVESGGGVMEHLRSTSNISTDVSNTERINRWNCAIRMFEDKPFLGFGPGTYPFQYGAYQRADEKTWISVEDGSMGGAHSEYLKPLSESGVLGALFFVLIIFYALKVAMDVIYNSSSLRDRTMVTALILGFGTYVVHGVVNFFLDTDKSSALFWGFLAMIVVYDMERRGKLEKEEDGTASVV